MISTFGEDEAGELYIAHLSAAAGAVYRLVGPAAPLPIVQSVTANRTSPVMAGTAITWTVNTTGGRAPLQYRFWRLNSSGTWTLARDYGTDKTFTWTPGAGDVGPHRIWVWVRNAGSTAAYDAHGGAAAVTVMAASAGPPPIVQSVTANRTSPVVAGTAITWTVNTTGGRAPLQYRFWRLNSSGTWTLARDYGTDKTFTWTPGAGDVGPHRIWVWVRNAGSTAAYDAHGGAAAVTVMAASAFNHRPAMMRLTAQIHDTERIVRTSWENPHVPLRPSNLTFPEPVPLKEHPPRGPSIALRSVSAVVRQILGAWPPHA